MRIYVEESILGTHYWTNAPKEVEFLSHEHHHNFHIRLECDVKHNDRELEFIMLRIWLKKYFETHNVTIYNIISFG